MVAIKYEVNTDAMTRFARVLGGAEKQIRRNVATAINDTKKKTVTNASRVLKAELPVPVRILKKTLSSKSAARENKLYARFSVWGGHPISLKHFKTRQTKVGVAYKPSKSSGGKSSVQSAFIIRKGGKVYRRAGKQRGPLVEQFGPSPADAIRVTGLEAKSVAFIRDQLPKSIERRLRAIELAKAGKIKLKTGMT